MGKIRTLILALLLAGCASNSIRPQAGRCLFWDNLETQRSTSQALCFQDHPKKIQYGNVTVYCNRKLSHRGKHHFHRSGECLYIW